MWTQWIVMLISIVLSTSPVWAMDRAEMSVWVNEAIIETYTYTHEDALSRQKAFARYFTADGWMAYSNALSKSKLIQSVQKNKYDVSAVATLPPTIKTKGKNQWQAIMPVLVLYQNPHYKQTQTLEVMIDIVATESGQGVRGLAITSFNSTISTPPCVCRSPS